MQADLEDIDFMKGMEHLLHMKADDVEKLVDSLNAEQLTMLADAVANNDINQLQQIVSSVHSDQDVNPLFRGENVNAGERIKKHRRKVADNYGYKFGDDVQVRVYDPETKQHSWQDGTVHIPDGPDDTVGVKIEGKARMVERGKVRPLTENMGVMGMVSMPNLERMQQLAGIPAQGQPAEIAAPSQEVVDPVCAAEQAMAALDAVEQVLPNVRLADLKTIRQRIMNLQTAMNET